MTAPRSLETRVDCPAWVDEVADWGATYRTDEDRMRLTIALSRENVVREAGGPFGAAIFACDTGALVGVGVNSVVRLGNSTSHAEMVAFMLAQRRCGAFSLSAPGLGPHELVTSCEPCAMCLGAALWSGVRRIVFGATREDAREIAFEEGPVFAASHEYLAARGIAIVGGVLRDEARQVLQLYRRLGGTIYNG